MPMPRPYASQRCEVWFGSPSRVTSPRPSEGFVWLGEILPQALWTGDNRRREMPSLRPSNRKPGLCRPRVMRLAKRDSPYIRLDTYGAVCITSQCTVFLAQGC
jgi:hypothetical protein